MFELSAHDSDRNDVLTFDLTSVTSDRLVLRNGRDVHVGSSGLDYEAESSISALVAVSDGQLTVCK